MYTIVHLCTEDHWNAQNQDHNLFWYDLAKS